MSLKNTNARDIDQLQMKPIKFVIDLLLPVLWHIFILYLSTGQYLKNMQLAKVSVLFTFGDRNEFSNCRRISILPIITKGLEKKIYAEEQRLFAKNSLSYRHNNLIFRRGMSTELALLTQKELVLNGFKNKNLTLSIFLDLSKAFYRVNHESLLCKREHYGFRGQLRTN